MSDSTPQVFEYTSDALREDLNSIYGHTRWATDFSNLTGLQRSTLYRYLAGKLPIPKSIYLLVVMLKRCQLIGIPLPQKIAAEGSIKPRKTKKLCVYCPVRGWTEAEGAPLRISIIPEDPEEVRRR